MSCVQPIPARIVVWKGEERAPKLVGDYDPGYPEHK